MGLQHAMCVCLCVCACKMCELIDGIGVKVGVGVRDLWRSYVSERGLRERAKYPKSGSLQATRVSLRPGRKTIHDDAAGRASECMGLWLSHEAEDAIIML